MDIADIICNDKIWNFNHHKHI